MPKNSVCQEGVVVSSSQRDVVIKIVASSACAACHAKGFCGTLDSKDKFVNCLTKEDLAVGDRVRVLMDEKLGVKAVVYIFVFPLALFLVLFFVMIALGFESIFSVLSSMAVYIPYYFFIYFQRERFAKEFVFYAEKIETDSEVNE